MPRYFFDMIDGDEISVDTDGTDLQTLDAARHEAVETLVGVAKDAIPETVVAREISITVRNEEGAELLKLLLSFKQEPPVGY